jgi:hypothetical protein
MAKGNSMREVCFILVGEHIIHVDFGSSASIPDSRERWGIIWGRREKITEIAHSHPSNFLDFSDEDLTTIEAVEAGIGRKLLWSVVTKDGFLSRKDGTNIRRTDSPRWLERLRRLSYEDYETKLRKEDL